jgi:GNAT superfamily N-acetyltransferase
MRIVIKEISPFQLVEYNSVPQKIEVRSILQVELVNQGLGGMLLYEVPVEMSYIKDYDSSGDLPSDLPKKFDVRKWVFFLALDGANPAGAATVAFNTTGVFMLEARRDLSVLWDIRVCPEYRGVGIALFRYAAQWSRQHGCSQMKIETQKINVPAYRFYQWMGAHLGEVHCHGYAGIPAVAHEVMLNWYLDLTNLSDPYSGIKAMHSD